MAQVTTSTNFCAGITETSSPNPAIDFFRLVFSETIYNISMSKVYEYAAVDKRQIRISDRPIKENRFVEWAGFFYDKQTLGKICGNVFFFRHCVLYYAGGISCRFTLLSLR